MIKGGYYIKARKIQESKIAHSSPCIREVWDWLIKEANHKDTDVCKRGECVRSYKDIQNGLSWFVGWRKHIYTKGQIEVAMKHLKRTTRITTKKTTRGMVIKVIKYDLYQTPTNYEDHNGKGVRTPQTHDTINKNVKNDKNKEHIYTVQFEKFWSTYPNKQNKKKSKITFCNISLEEIPNVLKGLKIQLTSQQWVKDDGRYIPLPTTWLNGERWNDEVGDVKLDVSERRQL